MGRLHLLRWRIGRTAAAGIFAAALTLPATAFDLQGHRGARGLAPENTLTAFERALAIGVSTLELDVGISADGVPVIVHDIALNPAVTRDERGQWITASPLVQSLTLEALQRFDVGRLDPASAYARPFARQVPNDGERIPTLASLLARVKSHGATQVRFNIETKIDPMRPADTADPDTLVKAILDTVREAGMLERMTLQSFDWRTLLAARRLEPGVPTACLTTQGGTADVRDGAGTWTAGLRLADYGTVPRLVKAAGCAVWSPNFRHLDEAAVREAQSLGLQVIPWTVNQPVDMGRLLDWKVDGLITDFPDRLRELMASRGMDLPPRFPR
jgi:glycerophosphoryl diester phosphodiesterase